MKVLGLTGSIGMGKTTAANMLRRLGVPVHDSDAAVHRLLGRGGAAVPLIAREFPGSVREGAVDRAALGAIVFRDTTALRRLEAILHPLVQRSQRRFLASCASRRIPVAVLDIPLLYETGGERRVDAVIVVTAPPATQRARVLARPGMTREKLEGILTRQMPRPHLARAPPDRHIGEKHPRPALATPHVHSAESQADPCVKSSSTLKRPASIP
jgi:dephospho-CoA kinase